MPQAVLLCGRDDLQFHVAGQQVVDGLFADQPVVVAAAGGLLGLGDVPAGEVAAARVQDLALLDGDLDRLPDLIPGRVPVHVMELVEIDVVRLQPLQAGIQRPADIQCGELGLVGPVRHGAVQLGGEHRVLPALAALGEPAAEDFLRPAAVARPAVDVGGVDEIDAGACAESMMAWAWASSVCGPKFMVPRHRRETVRPERPRCVYCIADFLCLGVGCLGVFGYPGIRVSAKSGSVSRCRYRTGAVLMENAFMTNDDLRPVYFLSDSTGITAETLGNTLLTQFPANNFDRITVPFITTVEQARTVVDTIDSLAATGPQPIVFSTAVSSDIRQVLATCQGIIVDLIGTHVGQLEQALGTPASGEPGRAHGLGNAERYQSRMAAVEYAMEHDDGQSLRALEKAQVILVAPSRCGKTPTTMYLALQHGIFAANFPLVDEDFEREGLPKPLRPFV